MAAGGLGMSLALQILPHLALLTQQQYRAFWRYVAAFDQSDAEGVFQQRFGPVKNG
jgi:hypothetical protein